MILNNLVSIYVNMAFCDWIFISRVILLAFLSAFVIGNTFKMSDCYFPFEFAGKNYSYCTKESYHILWCSVDKVYKGRWAICGPEVPPEILQKLKLMSTEENKTSSKLLSDEVEISKLRTEIGVLATNNKQAHVNKSQQIEKLETDLRNLNSTYRQLKMHQKGLEDREKMNESLRPMEIGMLALLMVVVLVMAIVMYATHCYGNKKKIKETLFDLKPAEKPQKHGQDMFDPILFTSMPSSRKPSYTIQRVQPEMEESYTDSKSDSFPDSKVFPTQFYHLTIDEDDPDDDSEGHTAAAAALSQGDKTATTPLDTEPPPPTSKRTSYFK